MGLIDMLNHVLDFTAPAAAVALFTTLVARWLVFGKLAMPGVRLVALTSFGVCLAVLSCGLWVFGRDGKMATYAAMVAACATAQWLLARGWKS